MNCDGPFCSVLCLEQEEQRMSFSLISNEVPIKAKEGTQKGRVTELPRILYPGAVKRACCQASSESSSKLQTHPEHIQTNSASL